jgi:MOSC domain-containing protein YiiM
MPDDVIELLSVQVGRPSRLGQTLAGEEVLSAIVKAPVAAPTLVLGVINLDGDDQADRTVHGGPDKAVYAYAVEDARWWESQEGRPFDYAAFGENLTTEGIDVNGALVGERWAIGSAVLEISEPRVPCWRLGARMNDPKFIRRFTEALRPGAYMRIVSEGDVGAGDPIEVVSKPDHNLSVRDVFRIYTRDRDECGRLLEVPQMSEAWKHWARETLLRVKTETKDAGAPEVSVTRAPKT